LGDGDGVGQALVGRQRIGPRLLLESLVIGPLKRGIPPGALSSLTVALPQRIGDGGDQEGDDGDANPFGKASGQECGETHYLSP
jgi:hypothetical protein